VKEKLYCGAVWESICCASWEGVAVVAAILADALRVFRALLAVGIFGILISLFQQVMRL